MIIKFENLGPLKNGEISLNKLTVIAGGNNTGKTYLTYTIFGLIQFLHQNCHFAIAAESINQMHTEGKTSIFCSFDQFSEIIQDCSEGFDSTYISRIFSTQEEFFSNTIITLIPEASDFSNISTQTSTRTIQYRNTKCSISVNPSVKKKGWTIECSVVGETPLTEGASGIQLISFKRALGRTIARVLIGQIFPVPWISTSERLGIALFYKDLDSSRNAVVEYLQSMAAKKSEKEFFDPYEWVEKATSRFAIPIHENINFVRNLEDIKDKDSELDIDLCKYISTMMDGAYKYQNEEIIFFNGRRGANKLQFPLHLGSSSLRSLTDIFFYLKHLVTKNSLIIIDEPESHLTPQNQVIFARLIGACINAGIRLIVTTHSDYLIKEINNLIMLSSVEEGSFDEFKKYGYQKNERLNPKDVVAYLCNKNKIAQCAIDKFGVEIPNLDEANISMNTRASHLYDLLDR